HCEGPAGWRGWSGGARDHFVIAAGTATPGYLPGPLEPGLWHVQLGLHQLPLEPVDIHVEVLTPATTPVPAEPNPPPAAATPRASARDLPAPAGLRWYAGDFHAHSTHSDGDQSLSELATLATGNGLDFLAVTEHNTISHLPHLPRVGARHDITLLPGQEATTPTGHANAIGHIGWVDFRRHPPPARAGGHPPHRPRQRHRGHRLGRLPPPPRPLARAGRGPRRDPQHQSSVAGGPRLAAPDAAPSPSARPVARYLVPRAHGH